MSGHSGPQTLQAALKLPVRSPIHSHGRGPVDDYDESGDESGDESNDETASPRLSVRLPARISTIDPETDPFTGKSFFRTCEETSGNLSEGGLFVSMRDTIPAGRRVLVEFELPGGQIVQSMGRVAWTRTSTLQEPLGSPTASESGVGIEFVGGHPEDRKALDRFLVRSLRARAPQGTSTATPRHV